MDSGHLLIGRERDRVTREQSTDVAEAETKMEIFVGQKKA
jgi:hypothetical protein